MSGVPRMDKGNAVAFGTLNLKANVLSDVSRPGGNGGHKVIGSGSTAPMVVGETRPAGNNGQGSAASGGSPITVGSVRPGGANGQGTGGSMPTPKRTTVLD